MFNELIQMLYELLTGKNPIAFSIIGLGIVALIYGKLRQIDKYVMKMHKEAEELKQLAQFPKCGECAYRDVCQKRIDSINECTYEYRKSLVTD